MSDNTTTLHNRYKRGPLKFALRVISYRGIACSYCTRDWIILSAGLVHTDKQDGFILTRVIIDTSLLRIRNDAVAPDAAQLILPLFGTDGTRYILHSLAIPR
jgi:hypothetical protein